MSKLKKEVEKWWKIELKEKSPASAISNIPVNAGVLARNVATCRYEDFCFAKMAKQAGLTPVWFEYTRDYFTPSQSSFKRSIAHPIFYNGNGRNGGEKLTKKKLVSFLEWDGARINEVNGGKLVTWHHAMHKKFFPSYGERIDMSSWLLQFKGAKEYYKAYLSLFLCHMVLFEDYFGGESGKVLDSFTVEVFLPARNFLEKKFGVKPKIVPLPWEKHYKYFPANLEAVKYL